MWRGIAKRADSEQIASGSFSVDILFRAFFSRVVSPASRSQLGRTHHKIFPSTAKGMGWEAEVAAERILGRDADPRVNFHYFHLREVSWVGRGSEQVFFHEGKWELPSDTSLVLGARQPTIYKGGQSAFPEVTKGGPAQRAV